MLELATVADAEAISAMRVATARDLTARYGKGNWSGEGTAKGVLLDMRLTRCYVAREGGRVVASLCLAKRKPWAIDVSRFTPCAQPIYLTSMVVTPERQRQGVGRRCLEAAVEIAREWPADAIRLDAYDAAAGAGGFYARCDFREVARASYRGCRLIYFEQLL